MTVECWHCQRLFDPVAARWRCTTCGAKAACCEGAPALSTLNPGDDD
jgi:hypothetical protein